MSTPAQVPMVDQSGQVGMVDAAKVDSARASGYEPAYKMAGPDGSVGYVGESKVASARQNNYSVTPDNPGVQRMATPQGQITYALPAEADQFKASGHVPIDDSGNFQVTPLPGEDNTDTMQRAATIGRNLPPQVMQQAIAAEKKTITPLRVATNLVAAPVIGADVAAGITGVGAATSAAIEGTGALYDLAVEHLAGDVLPGMEGAAARAKLIEYAPKVLKAAKELGIGAGGVGLLWKAIFGK